ncbi:protein NUCLEAR FUSION DEFECTIVE 4-like [Prosopis cineraria]|uniref:protein NUCLEAR FUSION DEFECTIVE 4-like n=1 Tax=Prosopis cineraria TaxID=364024 RepID=UPI00240FF9EC|nr:protein NUCLEAR FUSION DEFECTIVE 4-like [Prosopis cineraria]
MGEESRKWVLLVASIWVQAFTGTNFDFSSYSSDLKSVMDITQLQLNYLAVASDMGKVFGWCSGLCLLYLPLWLVMFISAFLGVAGYGLQWLVIQRIISLPYVMVFLSCLVAGCSICWFNTVCYVLCIKNFQSSIPLALSISISFNGVTAALYTFIVNSINSSDDTLYLLLNALVPLLISFVALVPILILRQQPAHALPPSDSILRHDFPVFISLYILSLITGMYLLVLDTMTSSTTWARIILVGAVFLLVIPLFVPRIVYSRFVSLSCCLRNSSFDDDDEIDKGLIGGGGGGDEDEDEKESVVLMRENKLKCGFVKEMMERDKMRVIYEEHSTRLLLRRLDFWLYYVAYLCGATIGLVYSNNLGQISESLGFSSETTSMVSLYSICSFFGRLLAAGPDFMSNWKIHFPRTGWYTIALIPTPIAFALLAASSGSEASLKISTGMLGLSSGFVFSEAVSITSELFGPNSAPVNHNILITNIPIGSCLFGLIAALVYDSNADSSSMATRGISWLLGMSMCTGKKCYFQTFIWWGCISMVGLVSSLLLFLRTRMAYDNFERNRKRHRNMTQN